MGSKVANMFEVFVGERKQGAEVIKVRPLPFFLAAPDPANFLKIVFQIAGR